jgi:hypothetical protein
MRKALVVGIDAYRDLPLEGCANDAEAVKDVLETHGDGSPNFSVRLWKSPPAEINKPRLRAAIEELFDGECDICLFYFSGHGLVKSTGGYIVTPDTTRYNDGISMDEILTLANQSRARDRVIFLDCCHSGALGNMAVMGNNMALLSEGLSVLTASRSYQSALEVDGKGVFTSLVVDALKGGAADLRGYITPGSIYSYVDQALGAWDQRPIFKTNVAHFTSLRSITPSVPFEILRKICVYFPNWQQEHPLDPSYEFTEKAAKEENVKIMKDLQRFASRGLVVPVGAEHMYFAAINSKSCRLTELGYQYWRLVHEKKL